MFPPLTSCAATRPASQQLKRSAAVAFGDKDDVDAATSGSSESGSGSASSPLTSITLIEAYDAAAAEWVSRFLKPEHLTAWDGTRQGFAFDGTKQQYVDLTKRAMRRYMTNKGRVAYKLGKNTADVGAGRLCAVGGVGFQNMCRPVRALLAGARYWDVDMQNAQPVLLEGLAKAKAWPSPALTEFNAHRETHLEAIMAKLGCDRDAAKSPLISLFFGIGRKKLVAAQLPDFFLHHLHPELKRLRKLICDDPAYDGMKRALAVAFAREGKGRTVERSLPAIVLQTIERECLLAMKAELERNRRSVDALIHDGCLVRKLADEAVFPAPLLRACEVAMQRCSATAAAVKLVVKKMTSTIVPPPEELQQLAASASATATAAVAAAVAEEQVLELSPAQLAMLATELGGAVDVAAGAITRVTRKTIASSGSAEVLITTACTECPRTKQQHNAPCVMVRVITGGFATLRCSGGGACAAYASTSFMVPLAVEALVLPAAPRMFTEVPPDLVVDDAFAARAFARRLPGQVVNDSGVVFVFDASRGLWGYEPSLLQAVVTGMGACLKFSQGLGRAQRVFNFSGNVRETAQLLTKLPSVLPRSDGYFTAAERRLSATRKLLFATGATKGIYDFDTGTLTPGFDPAIVFQSAVTSPFPDRVDEDVAWLGKQLFRDPFEVTANGASANGASANGASANGECPNGDRLKHNLMRALIGDIQRKKAVCGTGLRNSGKSLIGKTVQAFVGETMAINFDCNNLLAQSFQGEPAKEMAFIIPCSKARFAFAEEIRSSSSSMRPTLDASKTKKAFLTGGVAVPARLMRANPVPIMPTATLFLLSNDLPQFPADPSLTEKFDVVQYHYSFVDAPTKPNEKAADYSLEARYTSPAMAAAFFFLMVDEFARWKRAGFTELAEDAAYKAQVEDALPVTSAEDLLQEAYTITRNPAHAEPTTELEQYLHRKGFTGNARQQLDDLLGKSRQHRGPKGNCKHRFGIKLTKDVEAAARACPTVPGFTVSEEAYDPSAVDAEGTSVVVAQG